MNIYVFYGQIYTVFLSSDTCVFTKCHAYLNNGFCLIMNCFMGTKKQKSPPNKAQYILCIYCCI